MWRTVGHLSHAASTVPAARLKCRGGEGENRHGNERRITKSYTHLPRAGLRIYNTKNMTVLKKASLERASRYRKKKNEQKRQSTPVHQEWWSVDAPVGISDPSPAPRPQVVRA